MKKWVLNKWYQWKYRDEFAGRSTGRNHELNRRDLFKGLLAAPVVAAAAPAIAGVIKEVPKAAPVIPAPPFTQQLGRYVLTSTFCTTSSNDLCWVVAQYPQNPIDKTFREMNKRQQELDNPTWGGESADLREHMSESEMSVARIPAGTLLPDNGNHA